MIAALFVVAAMADWTPMRWPSSDPATLELLRDSPVNCLLIEQPLWSSNFARTAAGRGVAVLGVIRPGAGAAQAVRTAAEQSLTGVVLEGDFSANEAQAARQQAQQQSLPVIELPPRRGIRFGSAAVLGTYQAVWAGIRPVDENDKAHAMPSGAPWIDTNTGFLRYVRALHEGEFWIGGVPPKGQAQPVERYLQAVADAAMVGARWVIALDDDFWKRLVERQGPALAAFQRIAQTVRFYQRHRALRGWPAAGQMALVQDASSGALLSGGVLDMIAVKHTPVRPIPGERLAIEAFRGVKMAVNVDPQGLTEAQREALRAFTRAGGTLLNGPPDWKMPADSKNHLTVDEEDVKKLDEIWKEMNTMTGRRNLGVRLFNVSSMLSYFQVSPDGKRAALQLVNYSGYPVEAVTAHVLGRYRRAWLETPEGGRKALPTYEVEEGEGTGVDIDLVPVCAVVMLETE